MIIVDERHTPAYPFNLDGILNILTSMYNLLQPTAKNYLAQIKQEHWH